MSSAIDMKLLQSRTLLLILALLGMPFASRAQTQAFPAEDRQTPQAPSSSTGLSEADPATQLERTPAVNPNAMLQISPPLEEKLDPDKYICGRGDVFELNFWGQQNFKLRVTVDMEGRTFIPKVGYVDIVGKTLRKARETIRAAVLRYYPRLNFDLGLAEPRTFLVHVVENVPHPGLYPAKAVERASTILARAGGLITNASKRRIAIERRDGTVLNVDLLLYNLTGKTEYNPFLNDGDVIRVPFEDLSVSVDGAVKRPGHFELTGKKDLNELIELSGGLSSVATHELPIKLVRKNDSEHAQQMDIPFPAGELPALDLRVDDAIHIPATTELQRSVLLIGAIAGASQVDEATSVKRLPFVEKDTVRTLLERSGGTSAGANLKEGYILRQDGSRIPVDLEALLVRRDFSADRPVEMGDSVVVPYVRRSVLVEGAVFRPNQYTYNPKFTLMDYVAIAGGATRFAQEKEEIRLISPTGKTLAFSEITAVGPGDTIVVPERNFSRSEVSQLVMGGVGLALSAILIGISLFKK